MMVITKRFENRLDKSNVKFNTLNPVWDNEKEDAFNVFEMIDLLNDYEVKYQELEQKHQYNEEFIADVMVDYKRLEKENEQLKLQYSELEITLMNNQLAYNDLKEENEYYKSKSASLEESYIKLQKENEQLKSENNMLKVTIGRNEAYIKRLTETSEWHC
jgi:chromosome segregation ATPase